MEEELTRCWRIYSACVVSGTLGAIWVSLLAVGSGVATSHLHDCDEEEAAGT